MNVSTGPKGVRWGDRGDGSRVTGGGRGKKGLADVTAPSGAKPKC